MCIDRRVGLKETVFRNHISEIEVSLVECADCSDVFPITFEDKRTDVSISNRLRNNVVTEIDELVLQQFNEDLPVEDVNAHRCLK